MGDLFSYYAYRDSPIHRLDPRVKALWTLTGLFYIFSTHDWRVLLLMVGVNLSLAVVARFDLRVLLPVFRVLVLFGVVVLLFQLLFQPGEVLFALGPVKLHTAGLTITREVWLRVVNLTLLFVEYMMWTHPTDMALMWVSLGLPYRYAMMIGLALRFFPVLQREVVRIQEAQEVRGNALSGTWQRIAGLATILLPFALRVLRRTSEVALSMELRGFGYSGTRTYLRSIGMKPVDWSLAVLLMGVGGLRIAALLG